MDTVRNAIIKGDIPLIMFPRRANKFTVFENPMIDNFYIKVLGVQYPERVFSTNSPRFYQNMIIARDLDGGLSPADELIDSYTMRKNDLDGNRYANTPRDNTSFALVIQTERSQSGYVFDGIDSKGQATPFDIQFNSIYPDEKDTYYIVDPTTNYHPPAPQIWLCRDVYWTADVTHGLKFHRNDVLAWLDTDQY